VQGAPDKEKGEKNDKTYLHRNTKGNDVVPDRLRYLRGEDGN